VDQRRDHVGEESRDNQEQDEGRERVEQLETKGDRRQDEDDLQCQADLRGAGSRLGRQFRSHCHAEGFPCRISTWRVGVLDGLVDDRLRTTIGEPSWMI
jgi:hypothetical protein